MREGGKQDLAFFLDQGEAREHRLLLPPLPPPPPPPRGQRPAPPKPHALSTQKHRPR